MRHLGLVIALWFLATASPAGASIISFVQANTNGQNGVAGLKQGYRLALSPDGKQVYAVSQGDHALVTFARNAATGMLSQIDEIQDDVNGATGLGTPEGVEVSSDGKNVYVADAGIDAISAYTRDVATGLLTYRSRQMHGVGGVVGLDGVGGLIVSPDGKFVYGTDSNRISTFARDAATGDMTLVDELSANSYSGMGFGNGTSMVIPPDGKHLYASGTFANNLVVFARDQVTGKLTFVEERLQNVDGVTGLELPWAIAGSPDGKNIYVSGCSNSCVSTFTRNTTTGSVTYQGKLEQGVGGVDGMKVPFALTATPDGKLVLVNGASDSGVAVFSRDPGTGALTFLEAFLSPSAGLYQVRKTAVSPDGKFLYTITLDTHTVGVYAIDSAGAPPTTSTSSTTSSTSTSTTVKTPATSTSSSSTSTTIKPTTTTAAPSTSSTTTTTVAAPTTTTMPGCAATPLAACRAAGPHDAPMLRIVDSASPDKDRVVWTWRRGEATTLADLGDPTATTSYRLCVYENAVQNPTLVLDALAPAGGTCGASSCWKVVPKKGVRYRDRSGSSNGVVTVAIHTGNDRHAWIAVRSKGANLALPALPLMAPVTVQLQSSTGACWETVDSTS